MMTATAGIDAQGDVVLSYRPGFGIKLDEPRLAATRIG